MRRSMGKYTTIVTILALSLLMALAAACGGTAQPPATQTSTDQGSAPMEPTAAAVAAPASTSPLPRLRLPQRRQRPNRRRP